MPDTKISGLTALTGAGTASNDVIPIADVSATATKKQTIAEHALAIAAQVQTINAQTGTSYTIAATDMGVLVTQSNAGGITTTVPQDSDVTFAVGCWCELFQLGAGQITVAAGTGATLRSTPGAKSRAQYSRLFLQKIAANTWALSGDASA